MGKFVECNGCISVEQLSSDDDDSSLRILNQRRSRKTVTKWRSVAPSLGI
jgi:hypothetical protein